MLGILPETPTASEHRRRDASRDAERRPQKEQNAAVQLRRHGPPFLGALDRRAAQGALGARGRCGSVQEPSP